MGGSRRRGVSAPSFRIKLRPQRTGRRVRLDLEMVQDVRAHPGGRTGLAFPAGNHVGAAQTGTSLRRMAATWNGGRHPFKIWSGEKERNHPPPPNTTQEVDSTACSARRGARAVALCG